MSPERASLARAFSRVSIAAAAALAFLSAGCGAGSRPETPAQPAPAAGPKAVVLITVDSLRPGDVALYGGPTAVPGLARLAEGATVYDDARTATTMTRPSLATLMTGACPDHTGVRDDLSDRLDGRLPVLAERYRASGRTTAAFVTTSLDSYFSGLERGFEVFDGPENLVVSAARRYPPPRASSEAADHFAQWLVTVGKDRRFFAWVHLAEMQGRSAEVEPDAAKKGYGEKLASVDAAVGQILDALDRHGFSEGTEIVLAGTHGDLLGEGGLWGSSFWLTPETLRVPLIWRKAHDGPAAAKTVARDARRVWIPDVAKTLAAEIGGGLDASAEGVDLADATAPRPDRLRYAWTWAPDDEAAWPTVTAVDGPAGFAAFEWQELQGGGAAGAGELRSASEARPATPRERSLSQESRRKIEAAGIHLGSGDAPPIPAKKVRDESLVDLSRLHLAFAENRLPRMAHRMAAIFQEAPDCFGVLVAAVFRAQNAGDKTNARKYADRILELYPVRQESLHWSAHAELLEQRMPQAEALLQAADAMGPKDADVLYDLACTRSLSGDVDGSLHYLEESIEQGYHDWEWIERDTDLTALRADRRFADLMRRHGR